MTGVYVNLYIPSQHGPGAEKIHLTGKAMKILHIAFASLGAQSNLCFGVDFPGMDQGKGKGKTFSMIRVFAQDREAMGILMEKVNPALVQAGILMPDTSPVIKEVPENYDGPWVQCKRFRISSRKSFNKSLAPVNNRLTTMQKAQEKGLPFVSMKSATNKQVFRLYFERIAAQKPAQFVLPKGGYGLSTTEHPYPIPAL